MLLTSKYHLYYKMEMEFWSELVEQRVAINEGIIREILGAAYKYGVEESVWCLKTGSTEGNSFEDHIRSLMNNGYIVIEELLTQKRHILTLNGLVNGIRLHMEKYPDIKIWLSNVMLFHKKWRGYSMLSDGTLW